ncbi:MAG: DUF1080 domain-containing protein [Sphingobacteriaceae bacterium]|nr:DUF1080 domain-containing protein [Sphingobacteriaceae bacterium]
MKKLFIIKCLLLTAIFCRAQRGDPALTELWSPVPAVVAPGYTSLDAPSDAIILFNGKDASQWQTKDDKPHSWKVADNMLTIPSLGGDIKTKQSFGDCQLHIEWRTPAVVSGEGQGRGNSGIFLMGRYELQVLDSYNNSTYSNGQAGSIYKQHIPMVNASRAPGQWQVYDIIFTAPQFFESGALKSPARMTALHNGVLILNNVTLWGATQFIGVPKYEKHALKEPLLLQDHRNPVSFRNIWIREL